MDSEESQMDAIKCKFPIKGLCLPQQRFYHLRLNDIKVGKTYLDNAWWTLFKRRKFGIGVNFWSRKAVFRDLLKIPIHRPKKYNLENLVFGQNHKHEPYVIRSIWKQCRSSYRVLNIANFCLVWKANHFLGFQHFYSNSIQRSKIHNPKVG